MGRFVLAAAALLAVVGGARANAICDNASTNCDVRALNMKNVRLGFSNYPINSKTVVDGVLYDAAYQVQLEPGTIDFTFEIFPMRTDMDMDCSGSLFSMGGRTAPMKKVTRNGNDYCLFDITDVYSRDELVDHAQIYFLFNELLPQGQMILVQRNEDYTVLPRNDIVFWLYNMDGVTTATVENGTQVAFEISTISYATPDFNGIGDCMTREELVSDVTIGPCTNINLEPILDDGGLFVWELHEDSYGDCALESIDYGFGMTLHTYEIAFTREDANCHYINFSTQQFHIFTFE